MHPYKCTLEIVCPHNHQSCILQHVLCFPNFVGRCIYIFEKDDINSGERCAISYWPSVRTSSYEAADTYKCRNKFVTSNMIP